MNAELIQKSKEKLEFILNTEKDNSAEERAYLYEEAFNQSDLPIFINTQEEYFTAKGTHQAAIDIGNGMVAKASYDTRDTEFLEKFPSKLPFGGKEYPFMADTIINFREFLKDYNIAAPEAHFFRLQQRKILNKKITLNENVSQLSFRHLTDYFSDEIEMTGPTPDIYITEDLRENGLYEIVDYDPEIAKKLPNGEEIINNVESACKELMKRYVYPHPSNKELDESKGPYLSIDPHNSEKGGKLSNKDTLKKAFFLQMPITKGAEGKVVMGDFDHVYLFK